MENNKAPLLRKIVQEVILKAEKTALEMDRDSKKEKFKRKYLENLVKDMDHLHNLIYQKWIPKIVWTPPILVPEMPGFQSKYSIRVYLAEILFDIIEYVGYDEFSNFIDLNQKISPFSEEERKEFSEKKKEFLESESEKAQKLERILDIIENGELLLIREQLNQELSNLTGEEKRKEFLIKLSDTAWKIRKGSWRY